MFSKRRLLSEVVYRSGFSRLPLPRALSETYLTIFNYHRIRSNDPTERSRLLFDDGVYGPTAEGLRTQVRWLKANTDVLSEAELIAALEGRFKFPRRPTLVTFDDGYRDNFTLALPVLRDARVPAIFFIPTQAIEERKLGWWDLIAYLIKKTTRARFVVGDLMIDLTTEGREAAIGRMQDWMKLQEYAKTQTLIADLAQACEVELPPLDLCSGELMSWEEIRQCPAAGISIGSHTHSHRVLATLDLESQREELTLSKRILEQRLGFPIRSIAYPVGGYEHFYSETMDLARDCGYEVAFSFNTGVNRIAALEHWNLRRLSFQDTVPQLSATLALPSLFGRNGCSLPGPRRAPPRAFSPRASEGRTP